jgi:hypothetical protein
LERRYVILQESGGVEARRKKALVRNINEEIGHFSKRRTLVGVKKKKLWHDKIEIVRMVVRQCQCYQLAKSSRSIR